MSAPLPLAVIGCGLIGLRHAQVAQGLDEVELTAVVEAQPELRKRLLDQGVPAVATLDEVPARTRAAVIATPTPDHADSGVAVLDRGWAALVEKPVAATLAGADRMIDLAAGKGLPLLTGHHRRCHPFTQDARARLARIGAPVAVQGMWSLRKDDDYYHADWRRAPGAGPLMTNLSHEIDLMRWYLGEITEVSALGSNASRGFVIEDTAAVSLRFESGVLGSFLISDAGASPWSFEAATGENPYIAQSGDDYLLMTGTKGSMAFPSLTLWQGQAGVPINWHHRLIREAGPAFDRIDPIEAQMVRFAAVAAGGKDSVLASGVDGRATLEATLAAVLSTRLGRSVKMGEVPGDFDGA